jgi:hypothetical protein
MFEMGSSGAVHWEHMYVNILHRCAWFRRNRSSMMPVVVLSQGMLPVERMVGFPGSPHAG